MNNSQEDPNLLGRMLRNADLVRRRLAEEAEADRAAAAPPRAPTTRQQPRAPTQTARAGPWFDDEPRPAPAAPRAARPAGHRTRAQTGGYTQARAAPAYEEPERRRASVLGPPIPRTWIDEFLPLLRVAVGVAFIAYSGYATVFHMAADLTGTGLPFAYRYLVSLVAAGIIVVIETLTNERVPWVYWPVLVVDVYYTSRDLIQWLPWLFTVLPIMFLALPALAAWIQINIDRLRKRYALPLMSLGIGALWAAQTFLAQIAVQFVPETGEQWAVRIIGWLTIGITLYIGYIIARAGEVAILGARRRHLSA